jgi:hypothetical protein
MKDIGFSTGALALGDFRAALAMLQDHDCPALELSALRENELPCLMEALDSLDIDRYRYVSVHAPSRLRTMRETKVASLLRPCIERGWPVVLHPDAIGDHGCWRDFGALLCLENMDKRKPAGRTAAELERHFELLPKASLCLDLGHARQIDPTLGIARKILRDYGDRLVQIHLSELDSSSHHAPISMATVWAVREIGPAIPDAPVIIESMVKPDRISKELEMAAACFEKPQQSAASS